MRRLPFYLHRTPKEINLDFYEGYDPKFIFRKAELLHLAYSHQKEFAAFTETLGGDGERPDEADLHGWASELHCSMFHQFEATFALLLAALQPLPHWIFLTTYTTAFLRQSVERFANGRIDELSHSAINSCAEFLRFSVYPGISLPASSSNWSSAISDLERFLQEAAVLFLEGGEYNAYKHGLRVISGSASFMAGDSAETAKPVALYKHSISYLKTHPESDGSGANEVTKEIDPECVSKSFSHERSRNDD